MSIDVRGPDRASRDAQEMLDTLGDALVDAEDLTRRLAEALAARQAAIAQLDAMLDALADGFDDALAVVDHQLAVRVATPAARRLLGLDAAPAQPSLDDVLPPDVAYPLRRALGFAVAEAGAGSGPVTVRTADLELTARRATSEARARLPRGPVRWTPTAPEHVAEYAVVRITEIG